MFIGAKMLAEPWIHISTASSLAIVAAVIAVAVAVSLISAGSRNNKTKSDKHRRQPEPSTSFPVSNLVTQLASEERRQRAQAAEFLFSHGTGRISAWLHNLQQDNEFRSLVVQKQCEPPSGDGIPTPKLTVGIAVLPDTFHGIRAANGSPPLADVPADQDALEFELEFSGDSLQNPHLDILTTNAPEGGGAIARFLNKFGEGIQQVEVDVKDVVRATEILRTRFKVEPIYPAARPGANGTLVTFFLVTAWNDRKVLVELVEQSTNSGVRH
jgi:hypothetical protein